MTANKTTKSLLLTMLVVLLAGAGIWFALQQPSSLSGMRHVVLISLDTCRADYLSCYGYGRPTTPNIDALAREGYLFSHAMTPIPVTLPAHASMFTGTIPPHHGKHENQDVYFDPLHVTLAGLLKAKGYSTGAFVGSKILSSHFGLNRGFDAYEDRFAKKDQSERRAGEVNRAAFKWLKKQKKKPVFLFLHYYDPHDPYEPPEPFATSFKESPYAGEIAYTDYCIGQVFAKLKSLGMYESSLIIVTSDHGEMLGEHGELTHRYFIYQSAMKVPFVCKLPGSNGTQRIDCLASIIDIVPTICDLLDIEPPAGIQGKNLAGYFGDTPPQSEDRHLYCESLYPTKYEANSLLGIMSKRWKYIQTTRPELYDLQNDPCEQTNLVEKEHNRARVLKDRLAQILEKTVRQKKPQEETPLDEETLKHLSSLGYVTNDSVEEDFSFDQSKDDPKDLIGYYNENRKISQLVQQEKFAEALVLIENLVSQYPVFRLYELATHVALKQKDYRTAIRYGKKAVALKPGRFMHYFLGVAYSQIKQNEAAAEQFDLAIIQFKETLKTKPKQPGVLHAFALTLLYHPNEALRDPYKAVELAKRACKLTQSKHPDYLNTLSIAYAMGNNFSEAIKISEKALALAWAKNDWALVNKIQNQLDIFKMSLKKSKLRPQSKD